MPGLWGPAAEVEVVQRWSGAGSVALAAACLLAACGPAAPAVTARATQPALVAILDRPFGTVGNTLRLVDLDGRTVARTDVPSDVEALAVAGRRVLLAGGGRLDALDTVGRVEHLGTLAGDGPDQLVRGLVASPDGSRWMWSSVLRHGDGSVGITVYVAGAGLAARPVLRRLEENRALQPVLWTRGGAVLADEPIGIGGYVLFRRAFGPSLRLDPDTGELTPLTDEGCAVSDLSVSGTVACVSDGREGPHGDGSVTLRLLPRGGGEVDVPLAPPVAQAGAALFTPDGTQLTLATSPAQADGDEQVDCDVVATATGLRHSLGTEGMTPVAWLPDGRLLMVRRSGMAGGSPGAFAVAQDGGTTPLSASPGAFGVLD